MVMFLGLFLVNTLCAIVPCQRLYNNPVPVPLATTTTNNLAVVQDNNVEARSRTRAVPSESPLSLRLKAGGRSRDRGTEKRREGLTFKIPIVISGDRRTKLPNYIVKTDSGLIQGFPMKTIRARKIVAFAGIPYAEPPLKDLRYRAPVPKRPWKGVLQASKLSPPCMQINGMQLLRIIGNEDCLYANVYTPNLYATGPEDGGEEYPLFPVLVFIHGGSFAFSSGSTFGPAYLLDRDVLLVTFNYRLSSFGFLATGDEAAPGNWGLKDQNLLLKWVQQNIKDFGGDPHKVTLFGQSAGGVSVHLHMLSPQSKGLFQSGISQSGNAFCFWGLRDDSIDYTFRLANAVRCPVNESSAMVECLRKVDPHLITYTEANLPNYKVFPRVFFGPIVEPEGSDSPFIQERPEVLYAQNKVDKIPWINGFLADEGNGVGFLAWLYPLVMQELNQRWTTLGPTVLDLRGDVKHLSRVSSFIRQYYFGTKGINFYSRKQLTRMMGDRLILGAVHKGLKYHSRIAPTYGYFFNYKGKYGVATAVHGLNPNDWGISHDDDLIYLMNSTTYPPLKVGEPEYEMSEFLTNVWSTFATHGEPNFETDDDEDGRREVLFWDPIQDYKSEEMPIVLINGDMPKMIPFPFLNRVKFWDKMALISRSKVGPYTLQN